MQSAFLSGLYRLTTKATSQAKAKNELKRGYNIMAKYEEQAKAFCDAIRDFAKSEDAINNMECYLSNHFPEWLRKYAYDMETLSGELHCFAHMYD